MRHKKHLTKAEEKAAEKKAEAKEEETPHKIHHKPAAKEKAATSGGTPAKKIGPALSHTHGHKSFRHLMGM